MSTIDAFASPGGKERARYFSAAGGDWDSVAELAADHGDDIVVISMGPQHPSTHGVLRLMLELDGEIVVSARPGIGFLHSGIEKNMEFRTWTQGVSFVTRMDYVAPFFNEFAYCASVEKLLGITEDIPQRAQDIRVLMMELNRISSHLMAVGSGGMELGAVTMMTNCLRDRDVIADFYEAVTGLRMNHEYIRPGGVVSDLPDGWEAKLRDIIDWLALRLPEYGLLCNENPIFKRRMQGISYLDLTGCMALGVTGPRLRATGLPWDNRKKSPYCGYETYDFDVITRDSCDAYGAFRIRLDEMAESLGIVRQCADRLHESNGDPVMVDDPAIAWPAKLVVGPDGLGNSFEHIRHIMGESMEGLIHHFKLVTEGFRVPTGRAYVPIESPKGELGAHCVSDGGTRPFRVHFREPSFNNMQAIAALCEGGSISDVVVSIASIDPVMGGVDR